MARRFHPARKYVVTNSDDALSRFMGGELASPEFRFAAKIAPRLGELGVDPSKWPGKAAHLAMPC